MRAVAGVWVLGQRRVEHHPEEDHHREAEVEGERELGEERGAALRSRLGVPQRPGRGVQHGLVQTLREGREGELLLDPLPPRRPHTLEISLPARNLPHHGGELFGVTLAQPA